MRYYLPAQLSSKALHFSLFSSVSLPPSLLTFYCWTPSLKTNDRAIIVSKAIEATRAAAPHQDELREIKLPQKIDSDILNLSRSVCKGSPHTPAHGSE